MNKDIIKAKLDKFDIDHAILSKQLKKLKENEIIIKFQIKETKENLNQLNNLQKLGNKLFGGNK